MNFNRQSCSEKIKVLIADDHPMMLRGVRDVLSTRPYINIVGEALDGKEVLEKVKLLEPDIVVMDINMPLINGLEAACHIRREMPHIKVIILSMYDDNVYVSQFLESGALGYVLKSNSPEELLSAVDAVFHGQAFFSPSISQTILKKHQSMHEKSSDDLTSREEEILILIAEGYETKEIADKLLISGRTVSKHREFICKKLDLHSIAELTQYAISHNFIKIGKK